MTPTHVGFSDESNWNKGRFRSLGLVTAAIDNLVYSENEIRRLLAESSVKEFKWHKLGSARDRFAAQKLCRFVIDESCKRKLRVDVLIWDTEDSRHRIRKRDDEANLQRMYFHLVRNVLRKRWPSKAIWQLYPDPHSAMDWNTINDCLMHASFRNGQRQPSLGENRFDLQLLREFGIAQIKPVTFHECPLLQLADLFAGLAAFSLEKYPEYERWLESQSAQQMLFKREQDKTNRASSQISEERFLILQEFYEICKKRKLGVSLEGSAGLRTRKPDNPVNFWRYVPQHGLDKAPLKK